MHIGCTFLQILLLPLVYQYILGFIMLEFSRKLSIFCELIFFELSIKFRNKNTASYRAHINWLLRQNFSLSEEDPLKFCPTDG